MASSAPISSRYLISHMSMIWAAKKRPKKAPPDTIARNLSSSAFQRSLHDVAKSTRASCNCPGLSHPAGSCKSDSATSDLSCARHPFTLPDTNSHLGLSKHDPRRTMKRPRTKGKTAERRKNLVQFWSGGKTSHKMVMAMRPMFHMPCKAVSAAPRHADGNHSASSEAATAAQPSLTKGFSITNSISSIFDRAKAKPTRVMKLSPTEIPIATILPALSLR
mmetsp:Transcript_82820/g.146349  ORF Transcript_82820/g.146349 Transcript_82820/m.146349 type:complete len:220 (+) Transcript_82820:588-1247(+)